MIDLVHTDRLFLRADEVAAIFCVTKRAVYQWIALGQLPAVYAGRSVRIPIAAVREGIPPRKQVNRVRPLARKPATVTP